MAQAAARERGEQPNPVNESGLCLLSLDGGGVRGLSTLYILKILMARLNLERQQKDLQAVKPCELFDLIGGTSTGGLIAIMLGRLEMDVDECISAYSEIMESVFGKKSNWLPINWRGKIKPQFASEKLKKAIEDCVTRQGASKTDLFNDGSQRGCRVFVCTTAKETTGITRLRSYSLPDETVVPTTICDAALATSAATGFFDPVSIGARWFVDGALGANNPVDEVEEEASNICCSETGDLKPLVKCFISVGTGHPGDKAIEDNLPKFLSKTLVGIVTETENTATKFIARWRQHYDEKQYFRFNVEQGLQNVGLAEYQEQGAIEAATEKFLNHQAQKFSVRDCVLNLSQKQNKTDSTFASVVNAHKEWTIRHQPIPRKACWTVPFASNPNFVGREAQLNQLQSLFTEDQPSKVAIFGLGGVGKTQVVLELAHRVRTSYPDCSIIWIPATSTERFQQAYLEAGQKLEIAGIDDQRADPKKLVQDHLCQESAGQWLLIFDNADDIDMWINRDENGDRHPALKEYLPRSSRGRIIFTTRSRKVALDLAPKVIEVSEMHEKTAELLLEKSLIYQGLLISHRDTLELLQELTFLPLAIVQAAAYINKNNITFLNYLSLLKEREKDAIDLLSEDFEDEGRYRDSKNSIATTWLISFKQIQEIDPLAAEYLSFMCCVDPKDIPQSLLPPAKSRKMGTDAIGTLNAYAFVSWHSVGTSLELHRLVHLAIRNWLRGRNSLAHWTQNAIVRLGKVMPGIWHYKTDTVWRKYLPHAHYVLDSTPTEDDNSKRTNLLCKFAGCLYFDGRYDEAKSASFKVVEIYKRTRGQEHPRTLTSMTNLVKAHIGQGQEKEAEGLGVQIVEIQKRVLGQEHQGTLHSMNNLVEIYIGQRQWKKAETLAMQVIETSGRVLGQEHLCTLDSMLSLVIIYCEQEQLGEAERVAVHIMEIRKRMLSQEHPRTLSEMANLAIVYSRQGRWKDAEELGMQAIEGMKRVLGPKHPNTLISMVNLASTLREQSRNAEAISLMKECLKLRKEVLGPGHRQTEKSRKAILRWESKNASSISHVDHCEIADRPKQHLNNEGVSHDLEQYDPSESTPSSMSYNSPCIADDDYLSGSWVDLLADQ